VQVCEELYATAVVAALVPFALSKRRASPTKKEWSCCAGASCDHRQNFPSSRALNLWQSYLDKKSDTNTGNSDWKIAMAMAVLTESQVLLGGHSSFFAVGVGLCDTCTACVYGGKNKNFIAHGEGRPPRPAHLGGRRVRRALACAGICRLVPGSRWSSPQGGGASWRSVNAGGCNGSS
jgi:hypothetical protein